MSKLKIIYAHNISLFVALMVSMLLNPLCAEQWRMWIADGKSDFVDVDFKPGSDLCKSYFGLLEQAGKDNLKDIHQDGSSSINHAAFTCDQLKQTKIGTWGSYTVYDLTNVSIVVQYLDKNGTRVGFVEHMGTVHGNYAPFYGGSFESVLRAAAVEIKRYAIKNYLKQ